MPEPFAIDTTEGMLQAWMCVCGCIVAAGMNGHFEHCPTAVREREIEAVTPGSQNDQ